MINYEIVQIVKNANEHGPKVENLHRPAQALRHGVMTRISAQMIENVSSNPKTIGDQRVKLIGGGRGYEMIEKAGKARIWTRSRPVVNAILVKRGVYLKTRKPAVSVETVETDEQRIKRRRNQHGWRRTRHHHPPILVFSVAKVLMARWTVYRRGRRT